MIKLEKDFMDKCEHCNKCRTQKYRSAKRYTMFEYFATIIILVKSRELHR